MYNCKPGFWIDLYDTTYNFAEPCIPQSQHNITVHTILFSATDLRVAVRSAVPFYAVTFIFEAEF